MVKWIRTKEELPDLSTDVICKTYNSEQIMQLHLYYMNDEKNYQHFWYSKISGYRPLDDIEEWRDIPKKSNSSLDKLEEAA